ncbi:MAG: lytic transglycosylase domain-containing protein [Actinomycetota bacterium]|nr:lytic transglycosylase domain-containing protein [Actinomycetota bacterium]
MSKHVKHVPKHRGAPPRHALAQAPRKALRNTVILSSVAVAATGATVSGGLLVGQPALTSASGDQPGDSQLDAAAADLDLTDGVEAEPSAAALADREPVLSRSSDRREATDPLKEAALAVDGVNAVTGEEDLSDADPREIARALLAEFGYSADQFTCLDALYTRESNWNVYADNPTSSAYGIPQALPGSKMASAGSDWATNPVTQIRWGLGYIQDRYGSPCGAWSHSQSNGWY